MARLMVTIDIMPESPDINLELLQEEATKKVSEFGGDVGKVIIEPIAFGLKVVKLIFLMDESKGSTDPLENQIMELIGVSSAKVSDIRRTMG